MTGPSSGPWQVIGKMNPAVVTGDGEMWGVIRPAQYNRDPRQQARMEANAVLMANATDLLAGARLVIQATEGLHYPDDENELTALQSARLFLLAVIANCEKEVPRG